MVHRPGEGEVVIASDLVQQLLARDHFAAARDKVFEYLELARGQFKAAFPTESLVPGAGRQRLASIEFFVGDRAFQA